MARILILETSTTVCSVSIIEDDKILCTIESNDANSHSSILGVQIQEALKKLSITTKELNAVAVSAGPGSYTGLRVGSSTAKGLCYGAEIPFIALDTLKGLSYAPMELEQGKNNYIISMIDARRDEVYAAVYDPNHHELLPGAPIILDENAFNRFRQNNAIWHLSGNGSKKAIDLLKFPGIRVENENASSKYFQKMALNDFRKGKFEDIAYFSPRYFKAPNITKSNKPLI